MLRVTVVLCTSVGASALTLAPNLQTGEARQVAEQAAEFRLTAESLQRELGATTEAIAAAASDVQAAAESLAAAKSGANCALQQSGIVEERYKEFFTPHIRKLAVQAAVKYGEAAGKAGLTPTVEDVKAHVRAAVREAFSDLGSDFKKGLKDAMIKDIFDVPDAGDDRESDLVRDYMKGYKDGYQKGVDDGRQAERMAEGKSYHDSALGGHFTGEGHGFNGGNDFHGDHASGSMIEN